MAPRRQAGFTLLGLLFLVAGLGVALAAVGTVWETAARREKEVELLFIGDQYRRALESYYRASPEQAKRFPSSLTDLLSDNRFPNTVRHLRRLYRDPMNNGDEWGEIREGEEIVGVYSLAAGIPFKQAGFPKSYDDFDEKESYQEWIFLARRGQVDNEAQAQMEAQGEEQKLKIISDEERVKCSKAHEAAVALCDKSFTNNEDPARQQCLEAAVREHMRCAYFQE